MLPDALPCGSGWIKASELLVVIQGGCPVSPQLTTATASGCAHALVLSVILCVFLTKMFNVVMLIQFMFLWYESQ